jgi:hypothetical protein
MMGCLLLIECCALSFGFLFGVVSLHLYIYNLNIPTACINYVTTRMSYCIVCISRLTSISTPALFCFTAIGYGVSLLAPQQFHGKHCLATIAILHAVSEGIAQRGSECGMDTLSSY